VTNEVEQDPTSRQYFQTGKKTVQGVELGVTGDVTSNLSLAAGYTWMNTKVDSGAITTASGENNLPIRPSRPSPRGPPIACRRLYRRRRCALRQLAAARHRRCGRYAQVRQRLLGLRWHGRLRREQERGPPAQLYNIFDKDYVAAINKSGYRYTPGTPRSVALTANFKF
jgi:catecholate siderophore receptor